MSITYREVRGPRKSNRLILPHDVADFALVRQGLQPLRLLHCNIGTQSVVYTRYDCKHLFLWLIYTSQEPQLQLNCFCYVFGSYRIYNRLHTIGYSNRRHKLITKDLQDYGSILTSRDTLAMGTSP